MTRLESARQKASEARMVARMLNEATLRAPKGGKSR